MKGALKNINNDIRSNPAVAFGWAVALTRAASYFGRGWGANREDKALVHEAGKLMQRHLNDLPNPPGSGEVARVMQIISKDMQSTFGKYSRQIAFFKAIGDIPPGKDLGGMASISIDDAREKLNETKVEAQVFFRKWADSFWNDDLIAENIVLIDEFGLGDDITMDEAVVANTRIPKSGASYAQRPEPTPEPALPSGYGDW